MVITEILERNARLYGPETALVEREPARNSRREMSWGEFDQAKPDCDLDEEAVAGFCMDLPRYKRAAADHIRGNPQEPDRQNREAGVEATVWAGAGRVVMR
jgi:hypothetical protein